MGGGAGWGWWRVREEKSPEHLPSWPAQFNALNWRLGEWGSVSVGTSSCCVCVCVCLSSHCGNQFALCRTVDKERKRLPGGLAHRKQQQTQAETKPPLRNAQLWGTSSTTAGFHLINWEQEQRGNWWGLGGCVQGGNGSVTVAAGRSKPESF